jgi:hypothetical protein
MINLTALAAPDGTDSRLMINLTVSAAPDGADSRAMIIAPYWPRLTALIAVP